MYVARLTCWCLLALIFALSLAPAAHAAISGPFATSTPIAYTRTDWGGSLMFPMFNPALGTLTQVDISITGAMQTILTVTNTATSSSNGTGKTEVQLTVTDPLSLISMGPDFFSPDYAFSLDPGTSVTSGLLTKTSTDTQSFTAGNILSEFTGPGTIALNAGTYTQTWIAYNGGNTNATQVTDASATGTITYHYNLVPEPAGLLLLGPAFFGLVTIIKKRR